MAQPMTDAEFDLALSICSSFSEAAPLLLPPKLVAAFEAECKKRGLALPATVRAVGMIERAA